MLAYFIASAVRPRNATEMDITRMDMERRNLMANMGSMTPDERAAAFQQLNEDYPYADLVFMFRKTRPNAIRRWRERDKPPAA